MTFSHTYGAYNAEASINYFLNVNLSANLPSWWSTWYTGTYLTGTGTLRSLNFDYPEQPLTFPSFAVTHLGSEPIPGQRAESDHADGTFTGIRMMGMCEVDCWEQSKGNFNWMRNLRQMRDMVFRLIETQPARAISMYDFTTPASPSALQAVVRIDKIQEATTPPDPNPAVKRKRILLTYSWTERW